MPRQRDEIQFEVIRNLGTISDGSRGWKKEFNLVSWNNAPAKYDIRDWNEDRTRMGKGLTLTEEELRTLAVLFNAEIAALDAKKQG